MLYCLAYIVVYHIMLLCITMSYHIPLCYTVASCYNVRRTQGASLSLGMRDCDCGFVTHILVRKDIYIYIYIYIYMYTHMYLHTHVCTYIYIYTHTYIQCIMRLRHAHPHAEGRMDADRLVYNVFELLVHKAL